MIKKAVSLSVLVLLFASVFVFAQEDTATTTKRDAPMNQIGQERKNLEAGIKEKRLLLLENIKTERANLQTAAKERVEKLKTATKEEVARLKEELKAGRETVQEKAQTLRQNLKDNAKELRDNFKEKVQSVKDRAKIAAAHGRGLKMLNRYRSAIARFDHILTRLESRVEKLKARGVDVSSVTPLLEEAKNMKVENAAKLEELKAKYESLLEGDNPQGIGEEAKAVAQELKAEIEKLHNKLKEIVSAIKALQPEDEQEATSTSSGQ